jgi:hypothetical protein
MIQTANGCVGFDFDGPLVHADYPPTLPLLPLVSVERFQHCFLHYFVLCIPQACNFSIREEYICEYLCQASLGKAWNLDLTK